MATLDSNELSELSELAFTRISEAVRKGTITLEGKTLELDAGEVIRVCQWLSTTKVKQPRPVSLPEDFKLKRSTK